MNSRLIVAFLCSIADVIVCARAAAWSDSEDFAEEWAD